MAVLDIIYSILLNLFPLILFALPIPFIRKKKFGLFYSRLYLGLCVFFLVYWVLPVLFQFEFAKPPISSNDSPEGLGVGYLFARSFSMFSLYLQYPFRILPFIFIVSPVLSIYLLYRRLKKENKNLSGSEIIEKLNYEYEQSPGKLIRKSLKEKNWQKEKEIFKAFLIILPISLYLMVVILDIAQVEGSALNLLNVEEGSTALGWFIEILFVYLATFLFAFQLLKSSKISFSGRFVGNQIQSRFFTSLKEVGTPISVLSIILFIAQKTEIILLIVYFFAYFLMAAFIFITLLRVFEPISIFVFLKLVNFIKNKIQKIKAFRGKHSSDFSITMFYGIAAGLFSVTIMFLFGFIFQFMFQQVPNGQNFLSASLVGNNPSFEMSILTDLLTVVNTIQTIFIIITLASLLKVLLDRFGIRGNIILIYGVVLLVMTIGFSFAGFVDYNSPLLLKPDLSWITSSPIEIGVFGFDFYTMRPAFMTADFSDTNLVLYILSFPFLYSRAFVNFILWALFMSLIQKRFYSMKIKRKSEDNEGTDVNQITFIELKENISFSEFKNLGKNSLLLKTKRDSIDSGIQVSQEHKDLFNTIEQKDGILLGEIRSSILSAYSQQNSKLPDNFQDAALKQTFVLITYLLKTNHLSWWKAEFSYTYEQATLDGLYLLYKDGRDLLYYNFNENESAVDPGLVSGMFSAITSFVQETTKSTERLSAIESGDKKVLLEYSEDFPIFGAIFADRETTEVRKSLKEMVRSFSEKHKDVLPNWSGNMTYFSEDDKLVENIFSEFV